MRRNCNHIRQIIPSPAKDYSAPIREASRIYISIIIPTRRRDFPSLEGRYSGGGTEFERYRAKDLRELIERVGQIERAGNWLVRRTMEGIEIGVEGIRLRWLAGTVVFG